MTVRNFLIVLLVAATSSAPAARAADAESRWSLGFRAGVSAKRTDEEIFHLYEGVADFALPQQYRWASGWELRTGIGVHLGILNAGGQNGLIGAAGPYARLYLPGGIAFISAGARAALMSRHSYGDADLGGPFTFETDVGIGIEVYRRLSAGYYWQHLSNANLYDENPSVNLHTLALVYRF